ncbi:MAG: riboflavin kinase, partial [Pseudomonadota bacterium]
ALEVHIFDFKKDIYGEKIKVFFARKIREEKKIADMKDLKKQIQKDIEKSKKILVKDYKRV